jgi:hypothetical protein
MGVRMTALHLLAHGESASVERLGAPFAIRWRIRCATCDIATRVCDRLSLALDLHAEHSTFHVLQRQERAA